MDIFQAMAATDHKAPNETPPPHPLLSLPHLLRLHLPLAEDGNPAVGCESGRAGVYYAGDGAERCSALSTAMNIKFRRFNPLSPGLPKERRLCLVLLPARPLQGGAIGDNPPTVAVGFMRRTGRRGGAWWCVPGVGGPVTHYADCLGDGFPDRRQWAALTRGLETATGELRPE